MSLRERMEWMGVRAVDWFYRVFLGKDRFADELMRGVEALRGMGLRDPWDEEGAAERSATRPEPVGDGNVGSSILPSSAAPCGDPPRDADEPYDFENPMRHAEWKRVMDELRRNVPPNGR